ncbi:MAG TPA: DUF3343 domain-containing protein [Fastidiosipila sp.]|nr:DUF3343 domain-containing protein [Fastidiosipila sp.]
MKREKTTKLVLTFATMTDAMAADSVLGSELGRIIPVPSEIHAGCGLAWCADPAKEEAIFEKIAAHHLTFEGKHHIALY